jgi:hypothetical protein
VASVNGNGEQVKGDESYGWFRAMRHPDALKLMEEAPLAYVLAAFICHRAQYREGFNRFNLGPGEALLGDHRASGMSEKQYRTAKAQLTKWGFAAFKGTNKGTIGRLIDTRLFSIFRLEQGDQQGEQAADKGRTRGRPKGEQQGDFQDQKNKRTKIERGESAPRIEKELSGPERISAEKELERINDRLESIELKAGRDVFGTPSYGFEEKVERNKLKERRKYLMDRLGCVV